MSIVETSATARLFFALWPDEATRRQVVDVQNCLRHEVSGRWIQPDNLHVTLAFLGQVRADRILMLRRVAAAVLGESLELTLDRLDWWRQPQVLCLTSGGVPETLSRLVTSLSRAGPRWFRSGSAPIAGPYDACQKSPAAAAMGKTGTLHSAQGH